MLNVFKKIYLIFLIIPILNGLIFCLLLSDPSKVEAGTSATTSFTVSISVCGNDLIEGSEECDGSNLDGKTCVDLGYVGGILACKADCTFNVSGCSSGGDGGGGGGGGGGSMPGVTKVILLGKASPSAKLTILKDGQVVSVIKADFNANFNVELTNLGAGTYNFGFWSEDTDGRKSVTLNFTVTVTEGMTTTVSGIFIPPTIDINKINLEKGEILDISGQTAPESSIKISVQSVEIIKETVASSSGAWEYPFDTATLYEGFHTVKAKSEIIREGLISSYSKIINFSIGKRFAREGLCPNADLNKDGRINLVDFSILLHWWGKDNKCADQNQNNIVDLPDFSIMLYHWTG